MLRPLALVLFAFMVVAPSALADETSSEGTFVCQRRGRPRRPVARRPPRPAPPAAEEPAPEGGGAPAGTTAPASVGSAMAQAQNGGAGADDGGGAGGAGGALQRSNRMEFDERLVRGEAAGTGAVILFDRAPRVLPPLTQRRTRFLAASIAPVYPDGVPSTHQRRGRHTESRSETPAAPAAAPTPTPTTAPR